MVNQFFYFCSEVEQVECSRYENVRQFHGGEGYLVGRFGCHVMLCLVFCLLTTNSWASENSVVKAEKLAEDARKEREAKRYPEAIDLYLRAHTIQPDAAFLYNVAFIYDRDLGELTRAERFYRECISMPGANPVLVERSQRRLTAIQATRDRDSQFTFNPVTEVKSPSDPSPEEMESVAPYWITIVGGMTLVAGAVTGLVARHDAEQFKESKLLEEKIDFRESAQTQAIVADSLMLTGTLALVIGTTWLLMESPGDDRTARLRITPGALWMEGSF